MIGKPGRVGDHEIGRDHVRPVLEPRGRFRAVQRHILAPLLVIGGIEAGADVAFGGVGAGVLAERVVEAAEIRQVRARPSSAHFTRAAKAARSPRRPARAGHRCSLQISSSTLIRCATSLRVLLMFDCSSTVLRDVLLSWMLYSEPAGP